MSFLTRSAALCRVLSLCASDEHYVVRAIKEGKRSRKHGHSPMYKPSRKVRTQYPGFHRASLQLRKVDMAACCDSIRHPRVVTLRKDPATLHALLVLTGELVPNARILLQLHRHYERRRRSRSTSSLATGVSRVVVWQNARRESVGPCDEVRRVPWEA